MYHMCANITLIICTQAVELVTILFFFHSLQLLQKDKRNRLGVQNDFMDIRTHPFFGPINWQLLDERKIKPPYNPNVVSIERS